MISDDGIKETNSLPSVKTGKSVSEHHCERGSGLRTKYEEIVVKPLSGDEKNESKGKTKRKKPNLLLGGLSPLAPPEIDETVDDYR